MVNDWRLVIAGVALGLGLPAQAQQVPAVPGYTMPATQSWDLASDTGETYRILVSYPATPAPPEGFPVLYVLDGNAMFAGFAETRRIQEASDVGKSIIVGVGYPGDQAYSTRRLYDLTGGPMPPPWRDRFVKERTGGWDLFLDFLTGKLRTEIATRFRINPNRQALFGHSLGGLFAIHTLYERPNAFHAIIAASPSLFWHDREMLQAERDFAARLRAGKIPRVSRLMIVAGDREETALEQWDSEAFIKRMEPLSAFGLRTRAEIYTGEGHMTVPSRAVSNTLRFAFAWP
jgi:predicted alpha/beta superfamily hydrolase